MKIIKIIKYIYLGIISLLILFLGIFLISSLISKKDYTQVFGYSFFEVQSYSMYPELTKGDLVVVKKRDNQDYKVDMVVTYILPTDKTPTTHKIVKIEGNIITTRGINEETNNTDDAPFDVSCIIGEVVIKWKNYSKVRNFVTNPIGIIVILLCGFFFIEGFIYLESIYQKKQNKENECEDKIEDSK